LVLVQVHAVHRAETDTEMALKCGEEEVGGLAHIEELFIEREGTAMRMQAGVTRSLVFGCVVACGIGVEVYLHHDLKPFLIIFLENGCLDFI
jgi:hypothetical protein